MDVGPWPSDEAWPNGEDEPCCSPSLARKAESRRWERTPSQHTQPRPHADAAELQRCFHALARDACAVPSLRSACLRSIGERLEDFLEQLGDEGLSCLPAEDKAVLLAVARSAARIRTCA